MHAVPAPRPCGRWAQVLVLLATVLGLAATTLAATGGAGRTDPGAAVLAAARTHLGDTYTWGATGPATWDCSGLTSVLWREVGGVADIPRTSAQQQKWAVPIPVEQAETGDLFFYGDPVTHVGLVDSRHGTSVVLVDASSSQKGVVRRPAWTSGVVRYGRVPRRGMTPVQPWTPPATAEPVEEAPAARPALPTPRRALTRSQDAVGPQAAVRAAALPTLTGLPARPAAATKVATRAAALARATLGNRVLTDVELVRNAWRRAGGAALPPGRTGLATAAHRVPLGDARVGDLVVYPAPAAHVGIYVGNGQMVDASRSLGKVVLRTVWNAPGVRIERLPG